MSCNCGEADECDGEHAVYYPLQPGGRCVVRPCHKPFTVPAAAPRPAPAEPQPAAQQERKPLTEEKINDFVRRATGIAGGRSLIGEQVTAFTRIVESAHGITATKGER